LVNSREGGSRIYNRPIDVLILCTANQCRSPMAEVLLRELISKHDLPSRVISAGLYPSGNPATAEAIRAMQERGLDLEPHRSRQIDDLVLRQADLILCMAREHLREVAVADVGFLTKTFTLKELVLLGEAVGPRRPDEPLEGWLARLGASRRREALVGVGHDTTYDVDDPIGGTLGQFRATADEIEGLLTRAVDLLFPEALGRTA
jgi:protein-tyrosine phosphatase